MERETNILRAIESGDFDLFIKVLDMAFKEAAREASVRSHALNTEVADGRAAEDRRRKAVTPVEEGADDLSDSDV